MLAQPFPAIQIEHADTATPYTAGIESENRVTLAFSSIYAAQRRPVTEQLCFLSRFCWGYVKPRLRAGRAFFGGTFELDVQAALIVHAAHTREVIGDNSKSREAAQIGTPEIRFVAVHRGEILWRTV